MAALQVEVQNIAVSQSQSLQILSALQTQMDDSKTSSSSIMAGKKQSLEAKRPSRQIHPFNRFSLPEGSFAFDEEHQELGPLELATLDESKNNLPYCARWCTCDCHSRYRLAIPFGIGFFDAAFRGISLKRVCSENSCRRPSSTHVKLTLHFQSSVWNRIVHFSLKFTPLCGPEINIDVLGPWIFGPPYYGL